MMTKDTNVASETTERRHFHNEKMEANKQVLADGVAVAPYSPSARLTDEHGDEIKETEGHAWRLIVEPDRDGYESREEFFSLFLDIADHDKPMKKAAFERIYAAAEQLQNLARKIQVQYVRETGDIGPEPTGGEELQAKYDAEWGPEVVPNVRIKHDPSGRLINDDGSEVEGTRGHIHDLEFNDKALEERGGIFILADYFDDRDAPMINEAAAKRLLAASDQLRDTAFELAPHTADQLPRLMVEIVGGMAPRYVCEFDDPRKAFCQHHNATSGDGSVARILPNPGPEIVPNLSFAKKTEVAKAKTERVTEPEQPENSKN